MDNRLAVMQPYLFPYVGYFQLIKSVDSFVLYDDVDFIKQGWINRNKILVNGNQHTFTIPLNKASSFTLIKDTEVHPVLFSKWQTKFLKSLEQTYKKSPYFNDVFPLIDDIINTSSNKISVLAEESIVKIAHHLNIQVKFQISSIEFPETKGMDKADRLVEICKKTNSNHYINPIGGKELYEKSFFKDKGIQLNFIKPLPVDYKQFNNEFIPWLSIIDVLMFNSKKEINTMLSNYDLE